MKRWNGWGDQSISKPLPPGANSFLSERVGAPTPPRDASLRTTLDKTPPSRLRPHEDVLTHAEQRLRHSRGQSLPDWVALRSGNVRRFPDGVAYPRSDEQVQDLLGYAMAQGAKVIPYGGGTSVVGHVNVPDSLDAPVLVLDMSRMSNLQHLDETSRIATFGAGVTGPALERALGAMGMTLGHFPQSFEFSTLGGWIATRSSGQESAKYGRIEATFAGGTIITPLGKLQLPPFPASAAGPDLREMVLGSEGRMGVITKASIRVQPKPRSNLYRAYIFRHFSEALEASRVLAQSDIPFSMLRVSTPEETNTILAMSGHERLAQALKWALAVRGAREDMSLMLVGFAGDETSTSLAYRAAKLIIRDMKGIRAGRLIGDTWVKNRFRAAYLRNSLWEAGFAVDTLETAALWDRVPEIITKLQSRLARGLQAEAERVHVFTHVSHVYPTGSSIYCSYIFRIAPTPEQTLRRWKLLKGLASDAIVESGGTISHQHGVGIDHARYLKKEKTELGVEAIRSVMRYWDPDGVMNPGKLCLESPRHTH